MRGGRTKVFIETFIMGSFVYIDILVKNSLETFPTTKKRKHSKVKI